MGVIIGIMASSKLTLLFSIVLWASVGGSPSPVELTELEMEMRAKFEDRAEMMEVANRDMHNWWAEYDILMANYWSMFADNVCHNPDMLNASLLIIEAKIEKVRWGWTLKGEQLDLIRDILHHENYKNITGLAKVLNQFLEEQYDQMDMEGEHLDQEESEVAAAKAALNSHPCPCVWEEWSNWGLCSATCGGGVSTRNRGVEKEAVNGGEQCEGSTDDEEACHQEPCPIDCKWSEWTAWGECDKEYGDGQKHSQRMHLVPALFGGEECEGDGNRTKACNNLLECRQKVQQYAEEINRLENLLENRV